jgi:hypothetical protein
MMMMMMSLSVRNMSLNLHENLNYAVVQPIFRAGALKTALPKDQFLACVAVQDIKR